MFVMQLSLYRRNYFACSCTMRRLYFPSSQRSRFLSQPRFLPLPVTTTRRKCKLPLPFVSAHFKANLEDIQSSRHNQPAGCRSSKANTKAWCTKERNPCCSTHIPEYQATGCNCRGQGFSEFWKCRGTLAVCNLYVHFVLASGLTRWLKDTTARILVQMFVFCIEPEILKLEQRQVERVFSQLLCIKRSCLQFCVCRPLQFPLEAS